MLVDIGNARILGMEDELELEGNEYNIALFIFVSSIFTTLVHAGDVADGGP